MKPSPSVRVMAVMQRLAWIVLVACGGKSSQPAQPTTTDDDPPGVVQDTRTPIEKRRDAACEQLRPKLVQCAVDDARVEMEAGRMSKKDFDLNTARDVQDKLGEKWMESCRVEMSSRQVRVLEVCFREESQCGPLLSCLEHLNKPAE